MNNPTPEQKNQWRAQEQSGGDKDLVEYFERRKKQCEDDLLFAETAPGFKLFRVTSAGGKIDLTQELIQHLRESCSEYQRAIDILKGRAD